MSKRTIRSVAIWTLGLLGLCGAIWAGDVINLPDDSNGGGVSPLHERLVIQTGKFKNKGAPSKVAFSHGDHARRSKCRICHDTVKREHNSAQNTAFVVHKVCYRCHRHEGANVKQLSCTECHIP